MEAFALFLFHTRCGEGGGNSFLGVLAFSALSVLALEDFTPNGPVECLETKDISGFLCGND
jgi:hypothetical protein